jgi:hypothetical protein
MSECLYETPQVAFLQFIVLVWIIIAGRAEAALLRRIVLAGIGWERRRHGIFQRVPLGLAALVDDRLSSAERAVVADRFMGTKPCCLPPGFARSLREQKVDVRSPGFQQFLTAWLWSVSISIADIERRHSRNRRFVDSTGSHNGGGASWEQFAASYVNREASSLRLNQIRGLQPAREDVADSSADRHLVARDDRVEKTPKAMSAMELFRKDLFWELRAADAIINPCSTATWNLVRREWADLDQQKRTSFEDLAEASRDHCKTLRALRAARAHAQAQVEDEIAIEDGDANGKPEHLGQDQEALVAVSATQPACFSSSVVLVGVDNGASDPSALANMHDMHSAVVKEAEQRGEDVIFPISPSKLRSVIEESPGCISSSVRKLTAQFCCVQPHHGSFNADYAARCECFCKRSTPSEVQDMCSELLALWARWFPNKADIVRADPLVVIEVYDNEGRALRRRRFAMLCGCSSQSGRNRPLQQFAMLSPQCSGRISKVYVARTV